MTPEERLAQLGIELPEAPAPAAAYVPVVRSGPLLFTAGQVATGPDGLVATGKVGAEVDVDAAVACARQCAVNVLAQLKAALGELALVRRVVKLTVFVASSPDFTDQHIVANGASELVGEVFGDAGRHARSAVGTAALPLDSPVEVEAVVEVDESGRPSHR
ncbi:MAG: RidA family protein [Euzebyaceae bacterium]|nr:RidA family protein [Euzebyaceae bacterium]